MYELSLEGNIWKIALIRMVRSFMLIMPVIVLFFQENGLSVQDIFVLQAIFSVAVIVLEVPTGYISDRFGRKGSIVFGCFLSALGWSVYAISYGFWGFLVAEVLIGFGVSFISGSDAAMLYDSLKQLDQEREFKRMEGKNSSLGMISEGVASVIGGFLALISLRFPMYCEAIIAWAAVPIALSLAEPIRQQLQVEKNSLSDMWRLVKYTLHDHTEVKWLCLYSSIVGTSTLTMVWMIQPYLERSKMPIEYFGMIWATFMVVGAYSSWRAYAFEKKFGKKYSLLLLAVFPVIGYLLLGSFETIFAGVGILFFYIVRGIHNPVLTDYLNGLVDSDIRATVLSVKNLIGRILFVIIGPFIGWVHDAYSLSLALEISGVIFLFLGSGAFWMVLKTERK
jgi:MFS family permease